MLRRVFLRLVEVCEGLSAGGLRSQLVDRIECMSYVGVDAHRLYDMSY